jgi:hypothetical protein
MLRKVFFKYLEHWVVKQVIQPIRNKSEAILNIKAPKIRKETTTPVYCYIKLLSRHVVSQKWTSSQVPFPSITSIKVKFEWHSSHQQDFDKTKKELSGDVLLCNPDFNKQFPFHLYPDASDHQSGAIIIQDKIPISLYSRKLNTKKQYTTTGWKQKSFSAIENCKEYKNILLSYQYPIIVFIDYKNPFNVLKA